MQSKQFLRRKYSCITWRVSGGGVLKLGGENGESTALEAVWSREVDALGVW